MSRRERKMVKKKGGEIEDTQIHNGTKKMHSYIKELVGNNKSNKSANSCIKDKEGKMIFEQVKILER